MTASETWRLLVERTPARGAWNMAVDAAILESTVSGASRSTLRLYAWDPACLSLGYAQPVADVDWLALEERGWDLVRRPTGGRAVLHVDELTYSVCGPLTEPRLAGTVLESYNRLASALVTALRLLGLPVEVQERGSVGSRTQNPVCFEMPSTYEITSGGRKVLGSAQARRRGGVLQHGSLPLYGDLTRILQVLVHTDENQRAAASARLLSHATTVESVLGRRVTWNQAAESFITAFIDRLNLRFDPGSLTAQEEGRARELLQRQFANRSWTEAKKRGE